MLRSIAWSSWDAFLVVPKSVGNSVFGRKASSATQNRRIGRIMGRAFPLVRSRPESRLPWKAPMEASERPQLPLDEAETEGSVRVVEDRIQIENLEITDGQTARVVRERAESGEEPARAVRRAIEIGARVLDREDTAVEVDYGRREFEQLQSIHRDTVEQQNREAVERIEANVQNALGDGEAPGALGSALESHSGELA